MKILSVFFMIVVLNAQETDTICVERKLIEDEIFYSDSIAVEKNRLEKEIEIFSKTDTLRLKEISMLRQFSKLQGDETRFWTRKFITERRKMVLMSDLLESSIIGFLVYLVTDDPLNGIYSSGVYFVLSNSVLKIVRISL